MGDINRIVAAGISAAQSRPVPEIFPTVEYSDSGVPAPSAVGDETVLPPVIDPEAGQTVTVFEEEVASRGPVSPKPTDWDEFYDRYVILNPEVPVPVFQPAEVPPSVPQGGVAEPGTSQEETEVAIDWGDVLGGVAKAIFPLPTAAIDLYQGYNTPGFVAGPPATQGPSVGPAIPNLGGGMQGAASCPPTGPKYAKVCLATGAVMPLRQRRRRRLLTSSDLSDLAALKALFGNSAGVQAALVKAVRR